MAYNREEIINYSPGGDSVKIGIEKLDADLTGAFTHLNTINTDLTNLGTDLGTDLTNHAADTSTHGVGSIVGVDEAQTLTNKTISLANNTVSGTLAQFNAAVSDADLLDAATAASTYAPVAKGVTNGDAHDHSGGDGAQIAYSSLSGAPTVFPPSDGDKGDIIVSGSGEIWTIDANVVTPAKMSRTGTAGQVLTSNGAGADPSYQDIPYPTASETAAGIIELATSAEAAAGTDTVKAIAPATLRNALNASGSAPVYACRAWVNFNGTGTVAISGSGNVSSITDHGTGDYTVNFATGMPDANYTAAAVSSLLAFAGDAITARTTTTLRVRTSNMSGILTDTATVNVAIFR